jgi:tRNA/tmRNA/rRNA uracil-C5-methylase (TrmA/RlmC/RlmD family)
VLATERAFLIEDAEEAPAGLVVDDAVTDTASALWHDAPPPVPAGTSWRRRVTSFFQGNRYLTGTLVQAVLDAVGEASDVIDLYAGGGLFSVALAAQGRRVTAIESDPSSSRDLAENAAPFHERLRPVAATVEAGLSRPLDVRAGVVVLDPPRTGASPEAVQALLALGAPRVVYVSCDPATLARDAAKIVAAGYGLESVTAFDMFPNTPHIEAVAVFSR